MIFNTSENRRVITRYLQELDEDSFISDIVIPLFSSQGYYLYRINPHGPGEHGKDLIFYRHIPFFYDNEYLVVQAKSEKLTTSNVETFSSQIKRALKISFTPKSGGGELHAHYAVFINSRKHTSDADVEFQKLISDSPHIKVLSQETVCELIMKMGICPKRLLKQLSTTEESSQSKEDKTVYDIIMSNKPGEIDNLLNHKLKFLRDEISEKTKGMIIDYIYDRWQMDRSWVGTVKPMKWFDYYFDFFKGRHSKYLITIFEELLSSTPSFDALPYTQSVIRKITPDLLSHIEKDFITFCAERSGSYPRDRLEYLIEKLREFYDADIITESKTKKIAHCILLVAGRSTKVSKEEREKAQDIIYEFLYPDYKKHR
jgi:hypothetical protein